MSDRNDQRRIIALERDMDEARSMIRDLMRRLLAVEQKALNSGLLLPPSSSGGMPILWAVATSGIAAGAVSGTTPNFTLTPGSASCGIYSYDPGANTFTHLGTATVYNDFPNSGGSGVTTNHWAQIYLDDTGLYRILGEQC